MRLGTHATYLFFALAALPGSAGPCAAGEERAVSLWKPATEAARKWDYAKALELIEEAIRLAPRRYEGYYIRAGVIYHYKGDFDWVVRDCTKAMELAPGPWPNALRLRGLAYMGKREFKKAKTDLTDAIELDPKDRELRVDLGRVYAYADDWDKALAEFGAVCKADPGHYAALAWRGYAHCIKGEIKKALGDLDDAVRLKPDEKLAYFHRATALFRAEQDDKALADCDRILRSKPPQDRFETDWYASLHTIRGAIRAIRGDSKKAKADFTEAIRLMPDGVEAYFRRGKAHSKEGDFKKAVADFSEGLRHDPTDWMAYEMRAAAYLALGEREKSAADIAKAKELREKEEVKEKAGKRAKQ